MHTGMVQLEVHPLARMLKATWRNLLHFDHSELFAALIELWVETSMLQGHTLDFGLGIAPALFRFSRKTQARLGYIGGR